MRISAAVVTIGVTVGGASGAPPAAAHPSEPGVVNYAVLGKGSVGNIVGGQMGWESTFTRPGQGDWVDLPVCNNWADVGLPEVYEDPDLASFNGAVAQTSATDQTHFVKQAVGVFASNDAAAVYLDNGTAQDWSFDGGPAGAADENWTKQEVGTDRRCFNQTRLRENVLLQAKVCQSGNGGPAVNVLAGAMQNALGQ